MKKEDFYIGYLPKMPESSARVVKPLVVLLFALAISLAAILWIGQKPFAKSYFEFANVKDFQGSVRGGAIPFLLVEKGKKDNRLPDYERFSLVGEGKRGVDVRSFDGRRVKLKGTLIYRDDLRMIEVVPDSIEKLAEASEPIEENTENLGAFTLRGEIVDSKCYLGVMNPGQSKPHRECAVRCISGGVPPLFLVRDAGGNASELWLLSEKGESVNSEILDYVAEPVQISGEVFRTGDQLFFKIDPHRIERL